MNNPETDQMNTPAMPNQCLSAHLDDETILALVGFYKVMGDPTRLRLLLELEKEDEISSGDLAERMDMTRSAISHQLTSLKNAKLVKVRKDGKISYYSLDDDHIHKVLKVAIDHIMEEH